MKEDQVVILDDVPIKLEPPDLDGNLQVGGIEALTHKMNQGITSINQETEVSSVMKTLFPESNMNNTKMLGNINPNEETYILAFLILNKLGIVPMEARDIVLEKLLLSVSRNARGRDDGRDIMIGKREQDLKSGMISRVGEGIRGFFGMGGNLNG